MLIGIFDNKQKKKKDNKKKNVHEKKEVSFYYNTIYIKDNSLNEELIEDFKECGYKNKSDYLNLLIKKGYGREVMKPYREIIDSISNYILETSSVNSLYFNIKKEIQKRDEELEMLYNFNHIKKDKRKYYGTTFVTDLKIRMGNAIINEIVEARMNVGRRTDGNKKKKSKTTYRKEEILNLVYQTFKHNLKVIDEATKVFEEYQKKLREAEFERLVEEGFIDKEGNLRNDSEMVM